MTIRQAYGDSVTIARSRILNMRSLGQSMMPEGLEHTLSLQDIADLLEYLVTVD